MLFQSVVEEDLWARSFCTLTTEYVDAAISCEEKNCRVTAMRPSSILLNRNLANLNFQSNFYNFATQLQATSTAYSVNNTSPTEAYLTNINHILPHGYPTPDILSWKLQQLLNTYYFGAYSPKAMMGGFSTNLFVDFAQWDFYAARANGTNTVFSPHYVCHWLWFVFFITASTVMLAATMACIYLEAQLRGPDVIGYVSSLVRDTPYVYGGFTSSTLHGIERSKALFNLRLRLQDVKSDSEVGLIAISNDVGHEQELQLIKERMYR